MGTGTHPGSKATVSDQAGTGSATGGCRYPRIMSTTSMVEEAEKDGRAGQGGKGKEEMSKVKIVSTD